ncbi:hypothetical protein BALAC2494_00677 [Bifidobacterium animalis subsp. lactis CNCM I-2494]|uniref:Uncharacterized protein n=1 Tax=Bifidobacterium animalis subsp. lactis CNCM I-2494 TaxID=1042403 RepID=A0A806FI07_BIFAN|nr:hypothetical protein BALAC2494_00677 [Bifidobacterium animalis subsp. lactis CNCM I-2494]
MVHVGGRRPERPECAESRNPTIEQRRSLVKLRRRSRGGRQIQYDAAIWHPISPPNGQMSCGCGQWPMKHVPQWPDCGDMRRMTAGVAGNTMGGNIGGEYK